MWWRERTGRGVRVAVIDSGVHAQHPHIGGLVSGDVDRIGHGTAVAAAIREKVPDAELYAIRVFDQTLTTTTERLIAAIVRAADASASVINLSLGTRREEHRAELARAVGYATARGAVIVAAEESEGARWLPGSLAGVVPVRLDWTCPRETVRVVNPGDGPRVLASGFPRPIPGVPVEHNLKGISFAVANASGFVARVREAFPRATTPAILATLAGTSIFAEGLDSIVN